MLNSPPRAQPTWIRWRRCATSEGSVFFLPLGQQSLVEVEPLL
jgi:hypothetical protein